MHATQYQHDNVTHTFQMQEEYNNGGGDAMPHNVNNVDNVMHTFQMQWEAVATLKVADAIPHNINAMHWMQGEVAVQQRRWQWNRRW